MKIVVLMKRVPDLVEELEVDASGKALEADTKLTVNEFDDYALEEALLLKEAGGGEVTVMALSGEDVDRVLYTALAKGADRALKIAVDGEANGNRRLAAILAKVLEAESYDLIVTGVQAADDLDGQIAPSLAAVLGLPSIEVVTGIERKDGSLILHKEFSGGLVAELEVDLPAVLGIQASRQPPRYAPVSRVRQVQESATLETREASGDSAAGFTVLEIRAPETGEGAQMLGDVDELVKVLESKGVI